MKNQLKINLNNKNRFVWLLSICLMMIIYEIVFTSNNIISADDDWGEFDYKTEIKELEMRYKNPIMFDTIIQYNEEKIIIHYKYYHLKNSQFKIPKNYYFDSNMKGLKAFRFVVDINISINDKIIFHDTIDNNEITNNINLSHDIIRYGVIWSFNFIEFDLESQNCKFELSFSIPITDIGVGINLFIDNKGNKKYIE